MQVVQMLHRPFGLAVASSASLCTSAMFLSLLVIPSFPVYVTECIATKLPSFRIYASAIQIVYLYFHSIPSLGSLERYSWAPTHSSSLPQAGKEKYDA